MSDMQHQASEEVWLLNLGYVSEIAEQNLMLYGYLSSPGVANVELLIDVEKFSVSYAIVLDTRAYIRYKLQSWLERNDGLFTKLALFFFLKRLGSFDPASRIAMCVRDYAGPSWTTHVEVLSVKQYFKRVNEGRTKGWVFQNGLDEDPGTPGQERTNDSASNGS